MSGQHDGAPLNRMETALLAAAFDLDGELARMKADLKDALLESFAMRAPACPEWWQPELRLPREQRAMARVASWPWAYAAAVLAARPGGAK